MNAIIQESIGFLAGAVVTAAALPRVVDILRNHDVALNESYARNAMLVIGNMIWIVYGITGEALAVTVMCGLSASLNGMILVSIFLARRRQARPAVP
jgi:uncharacterized protein with PQ loop repeat